MRLGAAIRVRVKAISASGDRVRLRVQPEASVPGDQGTYRRGLEGEWATGPGQSVLIRGLAAKASSSPLWTKLFPGRAPAEDREVVLVITVRPPAPAAQAPRQSE